jgi:stearoyl-CoA desaturase (delta-9 desaturase)
MAAYSRLTLFGYWLGPVFILLSHAGCLLLLATGFGLGAMAWALGLYLIRMLATTAIYHRLLTHRSYDTSPTLLRLGCFVGASAGHMGPSWWKAHHLAHHRSSDAAADVHSPFQPHAGFRGFLWSQGGWLLSRQFLPEALPADVEADPVLRAIDRFHFVPLLLLALLSYQIGGLAYLGAFCLSTTLLFHGVQTVNSLSHLFGSQPFRTADNSRNNSLVAFLTLGEGWHNLHHAFQHSARHGYSFRGDRLVALVDPTFGFIRLLETLGLAWKVRLPSDRQLQRRRLSGDTPGPSMGLDKVAAEAMTIPEVMRG